uniref:Variant surface glycoprotein n=1 Tax=Trypanosoma brucei TaxID=5691 RepID=A0A1V0FYI2_9TRYP|nr:variant surface glycoprotein [Trypanosoma brucei]
MGFLTSANKHLENKLNTPKGNLKLLRREAAMYVVKANGPQADTTTGYYALDTQVALRGEKLRGGVDIKEWTLDTAVKGIDSRIFHLKTAIAASSAGKLTQQTAPLSAAVTPGLTLVSTQKKFTLDVHTSATAIETCGDELTTDDHVTKVQTERHQLMKLKLMPGKYLYAPKVTADLRAHGTVQRIGDGVGPGVCLTLTRMMKNAADSIGIKVISIRIEDTPGAFDMTAEGGNTDICATHYSEKKLC